MEGRRTGLQAELLLCVKATGQPSSSAPPGLKDKLVSSCGEKFSQKQADLGSSATSRRATSRHVSCEALGTLSHLSELPFLLGLRVGKHLVCPPLGLLGVSQQGRLGTHIIIVNLCVWSGDAGGDCSEEAAWNPSYPRVGGDLVLERRWQWRWQQGPMSFSA